MKNGNRSLQEEGPRPPHEVLRVCHLPRPGRGRSRRRPQAQHEPDLRGRGEEPPRAQVSKIGEQVSPNNAIQFKAYLFRFAFGRDSSRNWRSRIRQELTRYDGPFHKPYHIWQRLTRCSKNSKKCPVRLPRRRGGQRQQVEAARREAHGRRQFGGQEEHSRFLGGKGSGMHDTN